MNMLTYLARMIPKELDYVCEAIPEFSTRYAKWSITKIKRGRRLGAVCFSSQQMEINVEYYNTMDPETRKQLRQTLVHELAHLAQYMTGGRNHDRVWKSWMRSLGVPNPRACVKRGEMSPHIANMVEKHSRQRDKIVGICAGCGHKVMRTRRLPKNKQYTHKQCGGGLIRPV